MSRDAKPDYYRLRPLLWAAAFSILGDAWVQFLYFVPVNPSDHGSVYVVRGLLNISQPLGALLILGLVAVLLVRAMVALVRRRFRLMLSLGCAIALIPLIMVAGLHLVIFSPYYWYALLNQSRFEEVARSAKKPGIPLVVSLERRDVSTGLAVNQPTFTSIIFDERAETTPDPTRQHLYGHFYLIWCSPL